MEIISLKCNSCGSDLQVNEKLLKKIEEID